MGQAKQFDAPASRATIEVNGIRLQVREGGTGGPLVVFSAGDEAQIAPLLNGLAERNHLFAIDVAGAGAMTAHDLTRNLSHGLARLGLESFSVIGVSRGAPIALGQAIFAPKQIDKLILLSPPPRTAADNDLYAGVAKVEAPTLVLVGTRDRSGSADTARLLREKIGTCHLLLIYDAHEAITADRPEACLSPIGEFLERGAEFVVCHESQMLRR